MPQSRFFHVPPKGKPVQMETLSEILAARKEAGFIWLDYVDPLKEELCELVEPLGIHPLAVEDCLDDDQVPKMEDFPTNTFLLFNAYAYESGTLTVSEVNHFLGERFLITVRHLEGAMQSFYDKLDERVEIEQASVRKGPEFLLHVILDYIVDRKFSAIEALQEEIDAAEERVIKDAFRFSPAELMSLRRHILRLRKSLFHEREILVKICRRDSRHISEKAIYHYRDIYDHLAKFFEVTEIYREMISGLMEMYLSLVNNHMAMVANRTNLVMKRLTRITTIFMPLTLLAGIGGMSEWTMMTGLENWKISYPLFLILMVVIALASYGILKWIDAKDLERDFPAQSELLFSSGVIERPGAGK